MWPGGHCQTDAAQAVTVERLRKAKAEAEAHKLAAERAAETAQLEVRRLTSVVAELHRAARPGSAQSFASHASHVTAPPPPPPPPRGTTGASSHPLTAHVQQYQQPPPPPRPAGQPQPQQPPPPPPPPKR